MHFVGKLWGAPIQETISFRKFLVQEASGAVGPLIRVACLSSVHNYHWEYGDFGYLGGSQAYSSVLERFKDPVPRQVSRVVNIVVMHHHLKPTFVSKPPKEKESYRIGVVIDAFEAEQQFADAKVDFVMHGHQHQPFVSFTGVPQDLSSNGQNISTNGIAILGAGSAGSLESLPGAASTFDNMNSVNVYDFSVEDVRIRSFGYKSDSEPVCLVDKRLAYWRT